MASYTKRKPDVLSEHNRHSKKVRVQDGPSALFMSGNALPQLPPIKANLETAVFTHSSVAAQHPNNPVMVNYERLEFLGDAQIEHIASLLIFERYNAAAPGKMSTIRETLVKNETLFEFARKYGFDRKLRWSKDLQNSKEYVKIVADVFEAYVAAIIASDADPHIGFETARKWLTELWNPLLSSLGMPKVNADSKQDLSKKILVKNVKLNYREEHPAVFKKSSGTQTYFMGVYVTGWGYENQHLGSGEGLSKKEAEQAAAQEALENKYLIDDITTKRTAFLEQKRSEARLTDQKTKSPWSDKS